MNQYLQGVTVLGAETIDAAKIRAMRPLTRAQARRLVALALSALPPGSDDARQLANMSNSVAAIKGDLVPEAAAEILRSKLIAALFGEASEVVGAFDIASERRKMNDLKIVTVRVAKALLQGGQQAIAGAIEGAKQPWYKSDLPGATARDNVKWKLLWHEATLSKLRDPNALYTPGADLKEWVMGAFIEANAVEEGAAYLDTLWKAMWAEIADALAAIPKAAMKKLKEAADTAAFYTKTTFWVVLGAIGLVGYGGYKLLASQGASRVLGTYLAVRGRR